jgi:LysM repeat protein
VLTGKYQELLDLGKDLEIQDLSAQESGGKLNVKGTAPYQFDKDLFWDKIKTYSGWENEVAADIKVGKTDIYGYYTVKSGDTLSKISKWHLGDPMKYMDIFNINKDILDNPDLIKVGQKLKLPLK